MILYLRRQGLSVSAIARLIGIDRKTMRKYIERGLEPPRYGPRETRARRLEPFEPYLRHRPGTVRKVWLFSPELGCSRLAWVDQDLVAMLGDVDRYERHLRRRRLPFGHRRTSKVTTDTFTLETCRQCPTGEVALRSPRGLRRLPPDRLRPFPNVLWARLRLKGTRPLGLRQQRNPRLLAAGEADRQRLRRILQRAAAGGMPQRALVFVADRCQGQDRGVATPIQRELSSLGPGPLDARGLRSASSSHPKGLMTVGPDSQARPTMPSWSIGPN
jgi:hypothetical protein